MKSLKKAQAGIQTNCDPEDMMINKPGSTGGYNKAPMKKQYPWGAPVELNIPRPSYLDPTDPRKKLKENATPDTTNYAGPQAIQARMAAMKQKKGGSVKRKK